MSASRLCGDEPALPPGTPSEFGVVVLDGGHHAFLLRVPPFVVGNAVSVAVGAGEQSGVSGSGAGVGVVVVAVGEVRAVIEEKAEAGVAELVAVTLQVVAAELVDDDDDYQLGMCIVGRGRAADDAPISAIRNASRTPRRAAGDLGDDLIAG